MDWRRVPSLFALRAFEAAARTGGLSSAASELNVTHAAVAQHVRALEAELGRQLLRREGRGMAPTTEGAALSAALTDGFSTIAEGWEAVRRDASERPLRVAVTASFAEIWLMPRLPKFWQAHPGVRVLLEPSPQVVDLGPGGPDLAIRFGRGGWDRPSEILMCLGFVVVSAPGMMPTGDAGDPETFRHHRWLLDHSPAERLAWSKQTGLAVEEGNIEFLASTQMVLAGVRAGAGLSVQPEIMVRDDIARGTMESGFEMPCEPDLGYHLLRGVGPGSAAADAFLRWLKQEAAA